MRVIAGRFKGRRLKTPSWNGLRPTSDKLRETLFNVLASRLAGARVLDGYAGTGAVGIEALSRGAAHVTFVERDRRAATLIEANLDLCGQKQGYTIESGAVTTTLEAAAGRDATDREGVLERATRRMPVAPPSLRRVRDIPSGDSTLTCFTLQREM